MVNIPKRLPTAPIAPTVTPVIETGKGDIAFTEGSVVLAGQSYPVDALKKEELALIVRDFQDTLPLLIPNENEVPGKIAEIFKDNEQLVMNFVRVAMRKSGLSYTGKVGLGNGLVLTPIKASYFGSATTPKLQWQKTYSSTGSNAWIEDPDTPGKPFTLDKDAYLILFGEFVPQGVSSIVDAVDIEKGGNNWVHWPLSYIDRDCRINKYVSPIVLLGNDTVTVHHYAVQTGVDYSIPIGLAVVRSNTIRGFSATSPLLNK